MKIKVLYVGKRINGDKVMPCFQYKNKRIFFKHVKYCAIGNYYECFKNKKSISMATVPQAVTSDKISEKIIEGFIEEEDIAIQFQHRKRAASKINTHDGIKRVCELLTPILGSLRFSDQRLLLDFILDMVNLQNKKRSRA